MVYGLWFRDMVYGLWFMVYGLWFMVYGLGRDVRERQRCRVSRLRARQPRDRDGRRVGVRERVAGRERHLLQG